jgi:hypothetical protein
VVEAAERGSKGRYEGTSGSAGMKRKVVEAVERGSSASASYRYWYNFRLKKS